MGKFNSIKFISVFLGTVCLTCCIGPNYNKELLLGKWDFQEVSSLTEDKSFIVHEGYDFYLELNADNTFNEFLFYQSRSGNWEYHGDSIRMDYSKFGVVSYHVVNCTDSTLILSVEKDSINVKFYLKKQTYIPSQ